MLPKQLQYDLTRGRDDIIYFAEVFLGLTLHDGQKTYLRNATEKINLLVCANRWGKSVLVAVLHIHHCFYKIGIGAGNAKAWEKAHYATINLGPHSAATEPVFKAILQIMRSEFVIPQLDGSVKANECLIGEYIDQDHIRNSMPLYIPWINNSEILFRSLGEDKGTSIQGKHFGMASYDEGGRSHHLQYEIDANIIPRLADLNGKLHIPSTPDMESASISYHYDLFEKGLNHESGYYSQSGSIAQNVYLLRNNPTYIETESARLKGDPILEQVLYGKFVFAGTALYPTIDIQACKTDDLNDGISYETGHGYVIGIDTALGNDEMVYSVLREPLKDCPLRDDDNKPLHPECADGIFVLVRQLSAKGSSKSPEVHMDDFLGLVNTYWKRDKYGANLSPFSICLEAWDGAAKRFFLDLPLDVQSVTKTWGSWLPAGRKNPSGQGGGVARKAEILIALRKVLCNRLIRLPNERTLIKQLSTYREDDTRLETDRVISLALAVWWATDGQPKVKEVEYVHASSW